MQDGTALGDVVLPPWAKGDPQELIRMHRKSFGMCESLSDWGETVCATCPNINTIITSGKSTVVCVWDVSITKDKLKHMRLRQIWKTEYTRVQLPGHEKPSMSQGHVLSSAPEEADDGSWKWERNLVRCRELNRNPSASQRRGKVNPAITALAISRTHGTLLVGDAWGRVNGWSCEN
ncbi:WD repeat- and FYVE domain-containing protein 4 [Triplophysa tibetana]|uniref:WD repeat-and FYVE domain-containing protein 4 n=1 Tax=Triplophysa tibetana TaxID=1572043 RepID=A0A5A9PB43_9TELE|nr:WD repeat- and FYVE domain-containing protein 4 [Triplophysa tibetana]